MVGRALRARPSRSADLHVRYRATSASWRLIRDRSAAETWMAQIGLPANES